MKGIALIADKHSATCFKLAGLCNIVYVENIKDAEKNLLELLENKDIKIVLISEHFINEIQIVEKIAQSKCPVVIPIPTLRDQYKHRTDLMAELIRRKTGIEVKI